MPKSPQVICDILVIGSGFGGSLTALCLSQAGFDVCLVEKDHHPRFAIGESSTPIADIILRSLADNYDLPWLSDFSRFGSWQKNHPDIVCGRKRGFSYFNHQPGRPFSTDTKHKNELLVAASSSDELSDTNWLRSDFDAFLVQKVQEYGIKYWDDTTINRLSRNEEWQFDAKRKGQSLTFHCPFFIDATGSPAFLNKNLDISVSSDKFLTHTHALFSHFKNVKPWVEQLRKSGYSDDDFPYNPDYSALHQLMDDGWLWMLRFTNDIVSAGLVIDDRPRQRKTLQSPEKEWSSRLADYPSIQNLFENARIVDPPGKIIRTGRLQRRLAKAAGAGWAALPYTVGFVDPLHSSGIAHTLTGMEKLITMLSKHGLDQKKLQQPLKNYQQSIFRELSLADKIIAGCYDTMKHFELFTIYSMLYFVGAIRYEKLRLSGQFPSHFLCADNDDLQKIVSESYDQLQEILKGKITAPKVSAFRDGIKQRIAPYNTAGLLDAETHNMYHHTAAE